MFKFNLVVFFFRLLLKNVQRIKKVEQNIFLVNDCLEKFSNRIDKVSYYSIVVQQSLINSFKIGFYLLFIIDTY